MWSFLETPDSWIRDKLCVLSPWKQNYDSPVPVPQAQSWSWSWAQPAASPKGNRDPSVPTAIVSETAPALFCLPEPSALFTEDTVLEIAQTQRVRTCFFKTLSHEHFRLQASDQAAGGEQGSGCGPQKHGLPLSFLEWMRLCVKKTASPYKGKLSLRAQSYK